jgi:hypothetical protein
MIFIYTLGMNNFLLLVCIVLFKQFYLLNKGIDKNLKYEGAFFLILI